MQAAVPTPNYVWNTPGGRCRPYAVGGLPGAAAYLAFAGGRAVREGIGVVVAAAGPGRRAFLGGVAVPGPGANVRAGRRVAVIPGRTGVVPRVRRARVLRYGRAGRV